MSTLEPITVSVEIDVPIRSVWERWACPEDIMQWNAASDDWYTPHAENDFRTGGSFSLRMEAKDGSMGFDLKGTYNEVTPMYRIIYTLEDGRRVTVIFTAGMRNTFIRETFDPETINPPEVQRDGWQAILNNFKSYVERVTPKPPPSPYPSMEVSYDYIKDPYDYMDNPEDYVNNPEGHK